MAALLSGCARTVEAPPAAPAVVHDSWPGCASTAAFDDPDSMEGPPDPGSIPAGFEPTEAVLCAIGDHARPDGAIVSAGLERRAEVIGPLLSYLAQPSTVSTDPALPCPAMAVSRPWLSLLDTTGRWVTPAIPTDSCGFPLDTFLEAGPAYRSLTYRTTAVTELDPGADSTLVCGSRWKDMVGAAVADGDVRRGPIGTDPFDGDPVRVCLYEVFEDQTDDPRIGELQAGRALAPVERRKLVDALVGSPGATAGCSESASRFAVVQSTQGAPTAYVELDGCRRILTSYGRGRPSFAEAGATLVGQINALDP